jgi:uncharacterized protein
VIRAVLDANVLASGATGYLIPASVPGQLLRAWEGGQFELITSGHILSEAGRTLGKPYFRSRLSPEQIGRFQALFEEEAVTTPITAQVAGVATHPEDDLVLASAVSSRADYLVTGDSKLQRLGSYQGVTIVSPRQFLTTLEQRPPSA